MPTVRLDITPERLVPGGDFFEVFALDPSDPIAPPVGTSGAFNFALTVDGRSPGLAFPDIGGGPIHTSSASLWEGELALVDIVLDNVSLDAGVERLENLHTYLAESGFVPAGLADTVTNAPDIDLTDAFGAPDILRQRLASDTVRDALFAEPHNLSKLGITAFRVERGDILVACKLIGIVPSDGSNTMSAIVRTHCGFASSAGVE